VVSRLFPCPVWLAGGITPENAADAIDEVRPAGLDVATGAELPGAGRGEKDHARIAALAAICHKGSV
jgi:phosphoribosylanthranilate isomerase